MAGALLLASRLSGRERRVAFAPTAPAGAVRRTLQDRIRPACSRTTLRSVPTQPRVRTVRCRVGENHTPAETPTDAPPSSDAPPATGLRGFLQHRVLSGFDPTPELAAILIVYFIQGALGISRLALTFFFKDDLGLGPAEVASLTAISILPWLIKPLYGFMTDSVPLFGYRRRSYLVGAGALGGASWLWLATSATSVQAVAVASILASASVAISDVVADSLVVERVRDEPAARSGALQALCWGSSAFGGLLSAYFSGSLLDMFTARQIFAGTALLPLASATLAVLIGEKRIQASKGLGPSTLTKMQDQLKALWSALSNKSVYLPVLFVFLWQASPNPDAAMFFFNTNVLGFGPEFLGRVRLASAAASIVGLWIYQRFFREIDVKTLMLGASLAGLPLALTQLLLVTRVNLALGISDEIFALTDTAVLAALGQIAFMPTLVLAARLCPPGVEGTLFAALMSIYNASGAASNQLGGMLTSMLHVSESDYTNLWKLIVICSVTSLWALPLLGLLDAAPAADPHAEEGIENVDPSVTSAAVESTAETVTVEAQSVSSRVAPPISQKDNEPR